MAENLAVVFVSSLNLRPSNDGAGKTGSEEVSVLVDGVALDGAEDELVDKFLLQVVDNHALSTESQCLLLDRSEIFLLAQVGEEALEEAHISIGVRDRCLGWDWVRCHIRRRSNPGVKSTLAR